MRVELGSYKLPSNIITVDYDWTVGCANVSSALSYCARCLVQKHAKNNIYTSEIIIPARIFPLQRQ